MNILTKYSGKVEIDEKKILKFEKGIPGFPEEKQFIILPLSEDDILQIMQSVKTPELAFVITNPFHFFKDYDFSLDDASIEQLKLDAPEQVEVFNILTAQDPFRKTTANLQSPVIINKSNQLAKQVILNNPAFTTKHRIFDQKSISKKG
ncbi:flagellar assembly protein FliW [Bacillus sp. CECT 9360]|uniref:flagellar assembly protein FliW n=1 Tax=Bacillus sp. CECT 9360 TaxID=2845821 RepID=UPI001E428BCF|nr:flagellar assembly protein FliW [Bacillus sp. CECT 9360]CAH0344851.1 Flagellar assembly factor FliW [Bacillus sp. CECT 9360]